MNVIQATYSGRVWHAVPISIASPGSARPRDCLEIDERWINPEKGGHSEPATKG